MQRAGADLGEQGGQALEDRRGGRGWLPGEAGQDVSCRGAGSHVVDPDVVGTHLEVAGA